jgi:biotin carboxyl carrier protein
MIQKLRVTVDGKSYDVTVEIPEEPGAVSPPVPPPPVSALSPPPPSRPVAGHGAAAPGEVPSPMAGRVVAILVQPGQQVKEGDPMLTVEAMKMNTAVTAHKAGQVAEILTTVGAAVEEGQVLARLQV